MSVVCEKFGMDLVEPPSVKKADLMVLAAEIRDLFPVKPVASQLPLPPVKRKIKPVGWKKAERMFLERFNELWTTQVEKLSDENFVAYYGFGRKSR
jgi:hypothetical protein